MAKHGNIGNNYAGIAHTALWDSWAIFNGFCDRFEMLKCLYREWSISALADLFGIADSTMLRALVKFGIERRSQRGPGANGIPKWKQEQIYRRAKMNSFNLPLRELGRQMNVSAGTAKKYSRGPI